MRVFGAVSAAFFSALMAGLPAVAQVPAPKEQPPSGYSGNQYVDSDGCVFVRAGIGGQTTWVPRMSRDRKLVCDYEPTFPPGMLEAVEAMKDPAVAEALTAAEQAAPAAPTAVEPAVAEASAPEPVAAPAAVQPSVPSKTAVRTASAPTQTGPIKLVRVAPVDKAATHCLKQTGDAQRYLLSDGRRVTECVPKASGEPVAFLNTLGAPGLVVGSGAPSASDARRALAADSGKYRVSWSNGPIAGGAVATTSPVAHVPAAAAGRYVQVGVFAEPANAQAAIARLKSLHLPVASSVGRKDGRDVKAVMAGPFASEADLQAALRAAKAAGYSDAYIRG